MFLLVKKQKDAELHYFENEKSEESQGFVNLADCINIFPDGKPKQGIFILLTQSRAWKLQAVGDDADAVRAQWIKHLEGWLNEHRPGFKKLKKMGFDKPTVVASPPPVQKRSSVTAITADSQSAASTSTLSSSPSETTLEVPEDKEMLLKAEYGLSSIQASALNYRRLELQIKIAIDSLSSSAGNAELLQRVKELEEEREEKRSATAMREFQLSEVEREYAIMADKSRADFQRLLKRVSEFQVKLLKPGFEKVQNVFETVSEGDEPDISRTEVLELLAHFDTILPPVEKALHLSTTLLQKDRADVLNRVTALEAEIKSLQDAAEEIDEKKQQVSQAAERLQTISAQIKQVAEVFPTVPFEKPDEAVGWLKSDQPGDEELSLAIKATTEALAESDEQQGPNENLKLMQMEKIGANSPNIVLNEDGSIKMATVDALFSLLINGEGRIKHPEFENAILYGFPSFAQPMDLLEKVVLCFCSTLPPNFAGSRQRAEAIIEMNRKRLLNLVNRWILFHDHHFRERSFSKFFAEFIVTVELSGLKEEAQKLRSKMDSNLFPYMGEYEKPIVPADLTSFQLLDLAPVEVARQITRIDAALFEVIETRDFLETAWTSKNPNVAQSVKAITRHFNRMSQWVASEILQEEDVRRRALVLEFFIMTAEACLQINNFNGLLQIIGALSKTEIHRLKNTWDLVAKEKMKLMDAHREMLQSNCALLRQRYAAAKPPCLPYLGTYLTDLVMIGEQKTRVGDKINYRKLQLQEKCLSALVRRTEEGIKFPFKEIREIRSYVMDDSRLFADDNLLMARSQELEPRSAEGGTAKLVKGKSVSALVRGESRKVVRKPGVGGTDRHTVQLGGSGGGGGSARGSSTSGSGSPLRSTSSTMMSSPATERVPPPSMPPQQVNSADTGSASVGSPRSSDGASAAIPSAGATFRTMRSGMRASSPAGQISPLSPVSSSPMIGKRSTSTASGTLRSPAGSGSGSMEASPPEAGSPRAGGAGRARPIPAPRPDGSKSPIQSRRNLPPGEGAGASSPAVRNKALPLPPSESEDSPEESSEEIEVAAGTSRAVGYALDREHRKSGAFVPNDD